MFLSMLAGIIPLSLRNGQGAFDTVCPPPRLQVGGGATAPLPGLRRLICDDDDDSLSQSFSARYSVSAIS